MKVKLWGVRGSLPSSLDPLAWKKHISQVFFNFFQQGYSRADQIESFMNSTSLHEVGGFGTATSCVEVSSDKKRLIIDGGSGLRALSDELLQNPAAYPDQEFHFLMTHFHFDHILGLPFFNPHFQKGQTIHYYTLQKEGESIIQSLFRKPIFPVGFEHLEANIHFHTLEPYKVYQINGFDVQAFKMDHPDPCYGFRVEKNGKVYSHAVDNEALRTTRAQLGRDSGLYENSDLVFFDAQYDEKDMVNKKGWGHGSCDRGFEVARNFGVKQILFAHHDPSFSIQDIRDHKEKAQVAYKEKFSDLKARWDFAHEGQVIQL